MKHAYDVRVTLEQEDISALGVFTEPQRRRVFEQLQAQGPCTVSELIGVLDMGRTLVAFHLGKLLEAGFVEVVPPARGATSPGRPAQRYCVTRREVVVSVPDRRYDLLAGILLDSIASCRSGESAGDSAARAARHRGVQLARELVSGRPGRTLASRFARLERLLSAIGYSPRREGDELTVRNCPFDKFRPTNTPQVCGLNQALSDGYLEGLELEQHLETTLRPSADSCCVVFASKGS